MTAPLVFVSHGAPDVALHHGATLACWEKLGQDLPRPQAILVISAHWCTSTPTLSVASHPSTIHDFGGFPRALYAMQYPAPGAPQLQAAVKQALSAAGIPLHLDQERGLDHGAWIPLQAMYPEADIPVTQLSVQPYAGTAWHLKLGEALKPLREQNVLILASGAVTHNFGWLSSDPKPLPAAQIFSNWVGEQIATGDTNKLLHYREKVAPFGEDAHPTEEHFLPLFVTLGASNAQDTVTRLTPEFTYSGLAMDAYVWQ